MGWMMGDRFSDAKILERETLPWGNFGALLLGKGETYSGDFGESRAADRSVRPTRADYGSLRGLGREPAFYRSAEALRCPKTVKSIPVLAEGARNGASGFLLPSRSTEILRWESLASRATPLPQDDRSWSGWRRWEVRHPQAKVCGASLRLDPSTPLRAGSRGPVPTRVSWLPGRGQECPRYTILTG